MFVVDADSGRNVDVIVSGLLLIARKPERPKTARRPKRCTHA